ncbi:MAG TPA: SOS response-associated peptidase [Parvularculaceae bacterium]|nr:SOS response-associated peptidase [Parvularculaceae bacterium]
MCGKFTQMMSWRVAHDYSDFLKADGRAETVTPMRFADVLVLDETGARRMARMRWGFPRANRKDASVGPGHIHARAETIDEKPAFREAFRHRRGLLVVRAFNVAQHLGQNRTEQYVVTPRDGKPLALAVLWRPWTDDEGRTILTFTMATTAPSTLIEPIAERMPVVIAPQDWGKWLGEDEASPEELKRLLVPYGAPLDIAPEGRNAKPRPPGLQPDLF